MSGVVDDRGSDVMEFSLVFVVSFHGGDKRAVVVVEVDLRVSVLRLEGFGHSVSLLGDIGGRVVDRGIRVDWLVVSGLSVLVMGGSMSIGVVGGVLTMDGHVLRNVFARLVVHDRCVLVRDDVLNRHVMSDSFNDKGLLPVGLVVTTKFMVSVGVLISVSDLVEDTLVFVMDNFAEVSTANGVDLSDFMDEGLGVMVRFVNKLLLVNGTVVFTLVLRVSVVDGSSVMVGGLSVMVDGLSVMVDGSSVSMVSAVVVLSLLSSDESGESSDGEGSHSRLIKMNQKYLLL